MPHAHWFTQPTYRQAMCQVDTRVTVRLDSGRELDGLLYAVGRDAERQRRPEWRRRPGPAESQRRGRRDRSRGRRRTRRAVGGLIRERPGFPYPRRLTRDTV
jgi:hypothetical protein